MRGTEGAGVLVVAFELEEVLVKLPLASSAIAPEVALTHPGALPLRPSC
jgi:hypothetical protein